MSICNSCFYLKIDDDLQLDDGKKNIRISIKLKWQLCKVHTYKCKWCILLFIGIDRTLTKFIVVSAMAWHLLRAHENVCYIYARLCLHGDNIKFMVSDTEI